MGSRRSRDQYAYQQARSAWIPSADLDSSVRNKRAAGGSLYAAELGVAVACDSAWHVRLVRFVGTWLTHRVFRVRLAAPARAVIGTSFCPTMGCASGSGPVATPLDSS